MGNSARVKWGASRLPSSHDVPGQVWHAEATWKSKAPTADSPGEYDSSRLQPRIFTRRKEEREGIEKKIRDLFLHVPAGGIPPMKMIRRGSPEVRGLPFVRPTLIARIKSTGVYEARMCRREDSVAEKTVSFSPSPTTHTRHPYAWPRLA